MTIAQIRERRELLKRKIDVLTKRLDRIEKFLNALDTDLAGEKAVIETEQDE